MGAPIKTIIYEGNNYYVVAGDSLILVDAVVYLCINKYTGVVECEEQMLPKIVDYCDQLDEKVEEMVQNGILFEGYSAPDVELH